MREDARPLRCIHLDRPEPMAFGQLLAVELRQALVHKNRVAQEELAVVRRLRPDDILNKEVQGGAEVHHDAGIEARIGGLVLGDFRPFLDVQPMVQKVPQLRLRSWVLLHPLRLRAHLLGRL